MEFDSSQYFLYYRAHKIINRILAQIIDLERVLIIIKFDIV